MSTLRQRRGLQAEQQAATFLEQAGWSLLARNVRLGRDEIDILALDPGPPAELVCVEVRSATSVDFGPPEERIGRPKIGHLYRAMNAYQAVHGRRLPRRVDLVVVDGRDGSSVIRHLRRLEPP